MTLYTEYLSDLHIRFQVTCMDDTIVEYQIWNFCYDLVWSYADNRHTHAHISTAKKWDFPIQENSKRVNVSKSPFQKFNPKTILFLPYIS